MLIILALLEMDWTLHTIVGTALPASFKNTIKHQDDGKMLLAIRVPIFTVGLGGQPVARDSICAQWIATLNDHANGWISKSLICQLTIGLPNRFNSRDVGTIVKLNEVVSRPLDLIVQTAPWFLTHQSCSQTRVGIHTTRVLVTPLRMNSVILIMNPNL